MAWCGCSRKGPQCRASSGGGAAGWSVSTSTLYIPWRRRSSKALRPFSRGVSEWVFCAKNWQLRLDPLSPVHAHALLDALLGDAEGLAPLKQRVLARTQGNPFFLEESVQTL